MPNTYDIHYAERETGTAPNQDSLFAGDAPAPATVDIAITVATNPILQFAPLQQDSTTLAYEPWEAGNPIAAISAFALPVGAQRKAVYVAGCFNIDAIRWPASTTEAQVQAASSRMLVFRKLLWSGQRTGTEPAPGTPAGPA